jgi:transposase
MEKEYFLGIDLHKDFALWTLIDESSKILFQKKVRTKPEQILKEIKSLPSNTKAVLEPVCSWEKYGQLLEENGIETKIAHPLKTKAISYNRLKNDKVDSLILAELLRTRFLPQAHLPSLKSRELKELLRMRSFLKRTQARLKQKFQEILIKLQIELPFGNIFAKKRRDYLNKLVLPQPYHLEKEIILDLIPKIEQKIKMINHSLKKKYQKQKDVQILTSIPGIGLLSALYFKSEIDQWKRFSSAKKIASYAGLVPCSKDSGGKTKKGRITRAGSHALRWIFYEATLTVNPQWGYLYSFYQRIAQKGSKKKARVALARKMLCLCFYLLRKGERFDPDYENKEAQPRLSTGLSKTERPIEVSL